MKIQVMSDLHLEMHADGGAELIRELDPTGVDVLVLAGDITMARYYESLASVFEPLAIKYRHILYVPGNHEYYKSSPKQVARNLAKLAKEVPHVVIPQNEITVIAGQRFIAGTMWFRPDPLGDLNKRFMHDFSLIQDFEPWVYDQNAAFEKVLATHVEAGDVVVTHHLPRVGERPAAVRPLGDERVLRLRRDLVHPPESTEDLDPRPHPRPLRLHARRDPRRREPAGLSE
jgi:predicted MPP superfamily phosphohydrolase